MAPHANAAFDAPVPPGGYRWWYLDVLDPTQDLGLTVILFVGSVFSPRYYAARQRQGAGAVDPMDYCAVNVALDRPRGGRFVMTEVPRSAVTRSPEALHIGGSTARWVDGALRVTLDERAAPFGQRVAGEITLRPHHVFAPTLDLSGDGAHTWCPVAPLADAEVSLTHPALTFRGPAYHDMNWGAAPLEAHFARWHWSRARTATGATVLYDTDRLDGSHGAVSLAFGADGSLGPADAPQAVSLPRTGWRLPRPTRAPAGAQVEVAQTLLDAPFYNRSALRITGADGAVAPAVHEYLDLGRFAAPWVRGLLPFRMKGGFGR